MDGGDIVLDQFSEDKPDRSRSPTPNPDRRRYAAGLQTEVGVEENLQAFVPLKKNKVVM